MFHATNIKNERKLIKMLERKPNHVTFSWENLFDTESSRKLQILNCIREWRTVYWGKKDGYKVENLAPCTCYNFRIKTDDMEDENWINFKGATDEGPFYTIMHMTRYVKLGKTSVVRKIVHVRPYLLDAENRENKTPLVQAIEAKDIQMINLLISLGANINKSIMYTRRTPLMIAVEKARLQIATLLVDKGADVFAKDVNEMNILHVAVDSNDLESVQFSIKLVKDPNLKDNKGWTPLLRAAIIGASKDIIDLLLKNGAGKTIKDYNGMDFESHCHLSK